MISFVLVNEFIIKDRSLKINGCSECKTIQDVINKSKNLEEQDTLFNDLVIGMSKTQVEEKLDKNIIFESKKQDMFNDNISISFDIRPLFKNDSLYGLSFKFDNSYRVYNEYRKFKDIVLFIDSDIFEFLNYPYCLSTEKKYDEFFTHTYYPYKNQKYELTINKLTSELIITKW